MFLLSYEGARKAGSSPSFRGEVVPMEADAEIDKVSRATKAVGVAVKVWDM